MSNLTQSVEYKNDENDENINEINNTIEKQNEKQVVTESKTSYIGIIWGIFNICIWIVAIYLSFKCNEPFSIGSFFIAFCCPHIYLIFTLAKYGKCDALVKRYAEQAAEQAAKAKA
jgi:hypothetical protein